MTDTNLLMAWFASFLAQFPEILVALALIVWTLVKWRKAPASSGWALAGFGLLLLIALLAPGMQIAAQRWVMENHDDLKRAGLVLTIFSALGSAVRASAYLLLAAAVYTGRSSPVIPPATSPPPLPPYQNAPPV